MLLPNPFLFLLALYIYLGLLNFASRHCILCLVLNYPQKKNVLTEIVRSIFKPCSWLWEIINKFQIHLRIYMFVPNLYTSCVHILYYIWELSWIRFGPCFISAVFPTPRRPKINRKFYTLPSKFLLYEDSTNFYRN